MVYTLFCWQSRSILDKMVSSYGSFSDIPVNATGLLLKAATSAEISQIPGDIVKDVIGMLNDIYDDLDQSARRVIIEQVGEAQLSEHLLQIYVFEGF